MKRLAMATLALTTVFGLRGHAQPRSPIYVQYDGFVRNKDAHTLTLSFGYYNLNVVPVTIQPGDANGFLPGPADRKQAILFRPGRHRFACTIIVPDTFNGSLLCLKRGGRLVTCGSTSGQSTQINLFQLYLQQYRIFGSFGCTIRNVHESLARMASGLTPVVDTEVPLAEFEKGLARLEGRQVFGKIIVTF